MNLLLLRTVSCALLAVVLAPSAARAQSGWKEIGMTSSGNRVFLDTRSVRRANGLVTARVRVVFTRPVRAQKGIWASARTIATFDCAKRSLAARENVYYADAKGTKVTERTVNRKPGFGPTLNGSLGDVALKHLCGR